MEDDLTNNGIYRELLPSLLPKTAILEMTYRCNNVCLFCFCPWTRVAGRTFEPEKELNFQEWQQVVDLLMKQGITHLTFSGGEPLLKDSIKQIIEYACSRIYPMGIFGEKESRINLITNGKLLNNEWLECFKNNNVHLSISLPGVKEYANLTKEGDHSKILSWIEKAKSTGLIVTLNVTVTKNNLYEIYEIISAGLIAGADFLLLNRFLPGGRGLSNLNELELSKDEIIKSYDMAEEILSLSNRVGFTGTEVPRCLVGHKIYKSLRVNTKCGAATDFFVIDPSGYLRVCNHSDERLIHYRELDKLGQSDTWKRYASKNYLPKYCEKCYDNIKCDGGCHAAAKIVNGSVCASDPSIKEEAVISLN